MPELPEVESVRQGLERALVGRRIVSAEVLEPKILRPPFDSPSAFTEGISGRTVDSVGRRGKYLLLSLQNGYSLAAHLKMRGQMRVGAPADFGDNRFLCARFELDNGREWRYYDMWRWGELRLLPVSAARAGEFIPGLASMGPEPLGDQFSPDTFHRAARRSAKRPVKALLLDQDVVAGVGNIYADESLYRAGIHPERPAGSLSEQEWSRLFEQVRAVLGDAVAKGGTVSDNFVDVGGSAGKYSPSVYGRSGEKCERCCNVLQRTIITGRGTVFCIGCQPLVRS